MYIAFLTVYAFGRSSELRRTLARSVLQLTNCASTASGHPATPSAQYVDPAMRYLDTMCTASPDGLLAVSGKQNCLDLCLMVQDYIKDTRWELGASRL